MYNTDQPIKKKDDDLLGRATFAKQLGKALCNYIGKDSIVVGLYGSWGVGKTSVLNMALQEIEEISDEQEKKAIIVKFKPWNYSSQDNLIVQFFNCLQNGLNIKEHKELKKQLGTLLTDYANVFEVLNVIPTVGGILALTSKATSASVGRKLLTSTDIDAIREKIEKVLLDYDHKIIVVIDDIDRLTASQIRDVFQLVKQVADLPNILYLLSMDRRVVVHALEETQNYNGNDYLEKIVQIPFTIPEISRSKLNQILFTKLDNIIVVDENSGRWNRSYWTKIFENCVSPYLSNIRDVNRIINIFQFRYSVIGEEVCIEDLIAICTLDVVQPKLYQWISEHKENLCGGWLYHQYTRNKKTDEIRQKYIDEWKMMGIEDCDVAMKCVATLFPLFAKDTDEHVYGVYGEDNDSRARMRIAQGERFDLMFSMNLDVAPIAREVINAFVNNYDIETMKNTMFKINEDGNDAYFLDELRSVLKYVSKDRVELLLDFFFENGNIITEESSEYGFIVPASERIRFLIIDLLDLMKNDELRFITLRNQVVNGNEYALGQVSRVINRIRYGYGRGDKGQENTREQIVTEGQLDILEESYLERIQDIIKKENLLNYAEFGMIYFLWENLDSEQANEYLINLFEDDEACIKFLCHMSGRWSGSGGKGWSYDKQQNSKYIMPERLWEIIEKADKKEIVDKYSREDLIKIASFVLNYDIEDSYLKVNEEKAERLVEKWRGEFQYVAIE